MAEDEPDAPERPKKGAPPNVRIKASEEGAKVVARAVTPLEKRPATDAPEETARASPPPLAEGADFGAARTTEKPAEGAPAKRAKPPPPHAGKPPASRREQREAPLPERPAPPPPGPVRVRVEEPPKEAEAAVQAAAPTPEAEHEAAAAEEQGHPHEGTHPHISTDEGRLSALSAALFVVILVFLAELYAGLLSNSLALYSDAGHVFMDLFSYALAFGAVRMSQRKSSARETFGAHRAETVSAFVSGLALMLVFVFIYIEAGQRLLRQEPVDLTYMLSVPWLSVVANAYLLRRFHGAHDINIRGAHLHVWSDFVSALGVIVAGVLILATGNPIFDPLVSLFIGFLIFVGALQLVRESVDILLERTPAHIDVGEIVERVRGVPGVSDVHSVHVWSLCSTVHAMSAHVVASAEAARDTQQLLDATRDRIARDFAIAFTTFQVECQDCGAGEYTLTGHGAAPPHPHAQA